MFKCVSDDNSISYANSRIAGTKCSPMETIADRSTLPAASERQNPAELAVSTIPLDTRSYQQEIEAAALTYGVDQALVRAVIQAESAFRPNTTSNAGAQGLMQLMPDTARRFGVDDPFDAVQNIRGGVQYLAWLLKRYGGSLDLALAGYNSGEGNVKRYNGVPPFAETQTYVSRVKALAGRYQSVR